MATCAAKDFMKPVKHYLARFADNAHARLLQEIGGHDSKQALEINDIFDSNDF